MKLNRENCEYQPQKNPNCEDEVPVQTMITLVQPNTQLTEIIVAAAGMQHLQLAKTKTEV